MRSHRKAKQQDSRSTISSRKCFSNDFHKCRARNYAHLTRSRKHATQLHKEEMTSRITTDKHDHKKIRKMLGQYIKPFDTANHPAELVHVVLGKINSDQNVDVDEAVSLGTLQWTFFCKTMPADFHGGLFAEVKVKMMLSDKKGMQIEDIRVYDSEAIYAWIIGLLSTGQIMLKLSWNMN